MEEREELRMKVRTGFCLEGWNDRRKNKRKMSPLWGCIDWGLLVFYKDATLTGFR
jgi:hypothetical protein